ncbi:iron complex transport system substrate-binding protein [Thermotomaculum hydrothermale]|uniref:Iron complex transport system substrate-binding protein n=1 Tax=Thermotomaculum hydrothermale TaxID=981385 RepID=A0A7R6SZ31_9BACT|nr:helical backbone metal receptor [Thermotomaculum hydrothermale]BBB32400.1 iron complex transport system substrate-binding protein [Thermotomaculum hydrothermale]
MKKIFILFLFCFFAFHSFSKGVVSLLPSITEIIVEYGCANRLVAVSDYSVVPPDLKVERIGSLYNLNIEELIKLNPDIIFAEVSYKSQLSDIPLLRDKVVYLSFLKLNGVFESYRVIGEKLGVKKGKIQQKVDEIKNLLEKLNSLNKCKGKRVLLILNSQSNRFFACGDNYFSEIFNAIGFRNALKTKIPYPDISYESFYKINPDFVIVLSAEKPEKFLCQREALKKLNACVGKRVFYIYGEKVLHAGSGLKDLLNQVEVKLEQCFK